MILGSVLWSCSWGHWFLGVSSTLSQLFLEKWGSCGLQRWRWELGGLGQKKGEAEWLWFLGLWISASQCWDSESGRLRWRKKGIGSNNPLFPAGLIFNYQRCSAKNVTRAAHSRNVCNVRCFQATARLLIHSWNRKCALNTKEKLS